MAKKLVATTANGDVFEREPHRSRTCNLLIKRHEPYFIPDTNYFRPVSDIQKYSRDLCSTFYLLMSSVIKFVGKMLANALRLRGPSN